MEEETERLKDERCDAGEMQLMTCSPRPGETAQPGYRLVVASECSLSVLRGLRQLVLGQLGGVGGGHIIRLANTCTSCASSQPSVKTVVSSSIVLAAPGRF